jgi:hypothetical protein
VSAGGDLCYYPTMMKHEISGDHHSHHRRLPTSVNFHCASTPTLIRFWCLCLAENKIGSLAELPFIECFASPFNCLAMHDLENNDDNNNEGGIGGVEYSPSSLFFCSAFSDEEKTLTVFSKCQRDVTSSRWFDIRYSD